jgi:predicted RNase H-like nuclease (RuvC/YqgF family)
MGRLSARLLEYFERYRRAEEEEAKVVASIERREGRIAKLTADLTRLTDKRDELQARRSELVDEIDGLEEDVEELKTRRDRLVTTRTSPIALSGGFVPGTRVVTLRGGESSSGVLRKSNFLEEKTKMSYMLCY